MEPRSEEDFIASKQAVTRIISFSSSMWSKFNQRQPFLFEQRGIIDEKGIGELHSWFLGGRSRALPQNDHRALPHRNSRE